MALDKTKRKRLTSTIERIESFEEKTGVKFENLTATTECDIFVIHGDLITDNPNNYFEIEIHAVIYDEDNDILATGLENLLMDDFLGFETFKIEFFDETLNLDEIHKIRIYPKGIQSI